jgi:hypothetical protein
MAALLACARGAAMAQDALPPAALPAPELPAPDLPAPAPPEPELPPAVAPPGGDALPEPDLDPARSVGPTLPPAPGRIGGVRRGTDGRLAPSSPALPPDSAEVGTGYPSLPPAVGGVPMNRGTHSSAAPALRFYDPRVLDAARDRAEHEIAAKRRQLEIDRLVREEKDAKDAGAPVDARGLTVREAALIIELERMDRDVRDHKMAHYFGAQPHTAFPEYWYVRGPLGRRYAASGITRFDASVIEGDVPGSIVKLQKLRRAALAPREPSEEDRRVVAAIDQLI